MGVVVGAAALCGLVAGVLLAAVAGTVLLVLVGVVLGAAAGAGFVALRVRQAPTMALAGVTAVAADPVRHARLHNLTDGLCSTVGLTKPELLVVEVPSANAAALARSAADASLVVTAGLLEALDRVELEGVLAHQLRRIRDHEAFVATRAVAFVALPGLAPRVRPLLVGVDDVFLDDRAAVDVTRYPPGLVGALGKLRDVGTDVPGANPHAAHLWLAPLSGGAVGGLPTLDDRIAALREL